MPSLDCLETDPVPCHSFLILPKMRLLLFSPPFYTSASFILFLD